MEKCDPKLSVSPAVPSVLPSSTTNTRERMFQSLSSASNSLRVQGSRFSSFSAGITMVKSWSVGATATVRKAPGGAWLAMLRDEAWPLESIRGGRVVMRILPESRRQRPPGWTARLPH